ncbi:tetratricopeptide repeat protein [Psychroserpens sp.]|uniref:ATP-binding protein n=1 Tax=Psychroserpens sp. TaxID=2020870 RepID=UPI001B0EE3CA|nr:tetratricopeptide repeat protein [Psychroserpens sp.]MBO6605682.1 tetratricopeptide repeat protein [Psychroserpens sp.]MBO6652947.1 tetratricopeptide repeat protein [Psychroserpens sp.]MBO6681281.1 tetratricopeptide repeat protein [Psychroserpens sp.]MBO6749056.1 tetratricopeptide repeat protein [Psychroserpens sp.]MBO6914498.1 tetratricopeptide repeat protein [Psychroserpens sp.]
MLRILFTFLCFIIYTTSICAQSKTIDSILVLRKRSADTELSFEDRFKYAQIASELSITTNVDSTILNSNKNLAFFYMSKDFNIYGKMNLDNLALAKKINDSSSIASISFNLGFYHHYFEQQNDSAYYYYKNAVEVYDKLDEKKELASVLINIATLQQIENDFVGSEENAIKAIEILQTLPRKESNLGDLYLLYNLLGLNAYDLKDYEKSIENHENALDIAREMNYGRLNELYSSGNLALVYREIGDLEKAIQLWEGVLSNDILMEEDPSFFALSLENITYTKFLNGYADNEEIERSFERAYQLSDSLDEAYVKASTTISMTRYFKGINNVPSAFKYAEETYAISTEIGANDLRLESLLLLSKLKTGEEGKKYLNEHIRLSDSLLNVERNVRNKRARIQLETDELERENERIEQQRLWLIVVSVGLLITLLFIYIIITQRSRNKELQFKQDQQKANEEIYNLMLSQQDKVDEARANEKKRISEELHDGVLGRLFGTRLSLDSLNFSEGQDAIKNRASYIEELKTIENDIRKISHDLNTDFVSGSGFMDIVSELIEKQTLAYQLSSSFDFTDDINWESIPNKTKINIYRIIQESLQNIYKHANANAVKISIQLKNNVICLSINDDGDGFDINKSKKGIGIKNINSRVNEVEGTAEFNSEINKGTEVLISIPYKN